MDELARKAEFARNRAEARDIMAGMWAETRSNWRTIARPRRMIRESLDFLAGFRTPGNLGD